jgi:hypothetical protein
MARLKKPSTKTMAFALQEVCEGWSSRGSRSSSLCLLLLWLIAPTTTLSLHTPPKTTNTAASPVPPTKAVTMATTTTAPATVQPPAPKPAAMPVSTTTTSSSAAPAADGFFSDSNALHSILTETGVPDAVVPGISQQLVHRLTMAAMPSEAHRREVANAATIIQVCFQRRTHSPS